MKRQGQIVAATITNFEAAEKAMDNMANSAGSAEAEFEIYQQSAEYLLNQLKETFVSISQHAVDRDDLKNLIKFGTSLLKIVDGIVSKVGLLPALFSTIIGITASKKSVFGLFGTTDSYKNNGKTAITLGGTQLGKNFFGRLSENRAEIKAQKLEIQNATKVVNDFHAAYQNGTMTQEQYNAALNHTNPIVSTYVSNIKDATTETAEYEQAVKQLNSNAGRMPAKFKAAEVAAQALNTVLSVLVSMGISMAINAIIKSLDEAWNSYENNVKKMKELGDSVKSLESEYKDLNEQLKDSQKKLADLERIESPTLLEQGEIEKIREANEYLEKQIKLKELEIELEKKKLVESAENAREDAEYSVDYYKFLDNLWSSDKGMSDKLLGSAPIGLISMVAKNLSNFVNGNTWQQQTNEIEKYEEALEKANKAKEKYEAVEKGDKNYNKLKSDAEKAEAEAEEQQNKLKKRYAEWKIALETFKIEPETHKQEIKELETAIDAAEKILGLKKEFSNFYDLYNSAEFSKTRADLEAIAKAGELTAENFETLTENDVSGIVAFKEALSKIPGLKVEDVIKAINKAIDDSANGADNAEEKIKDYAEALDKLKDKLDDIISKQEKLAEAFSKTVVGGNLDPKEAYELIKEVPEAAKYLAETDDGYTLSQEAFSKVNEEIYHQIQTDISKDLVETRNQQALLKKLKDLYDNKQGTIEYLDTLERYESFYGDISEDDLSTNYEDTLSKLENIEESFEVMHTLMNDIFDERKLVVDAINNGYDEAKEQISDYNSVIKTVDDAIKSLDDNSKLTYDEMTSIVDIAPELQDSFTHLGDGTYSIAVSALEDLRQQSYKTRNDYIDNLIAEAKAEKESAEAIKKANQEKLGYIDEYGNKVEGTISQIQDSIERFIAETEATEAIDVSNLKIEEIEKLIEKLEGWRQNLTTDNGDDSATDELQRQIDYYKSLISAVEIVRDKYAEAIDKEIDALNDGKDALKEANDERQRELDLIEARNNLENAKKRKVWVYSEDGGFQQVRDEGAIKEAEEKYRDVIQDIQEAEIEKQIDTLEKQKDALEKQVEDMTELESKIEDSATVAGAMKALGLADESELLNLSDSVKQGIKEGLAEAIVTKNNEDNKDNEHYTPVTLDDVLKNLGATVTADDIKSLDLVTQEGFNAAVRNFADSLKEYQDKAVSSIVNNNSGTVFNNSFTINGVTDPEEVAKVVNSEMTNLFTKINNSIK